MFRLCGALKYGLSVSGLTQRDLAEGLNMSEQHISNLCTGKSSTSLVTAMSVASFLGVSLSEFISFGELGGYEV